MRLEDPHGAEGEGGGAGLPVVEQITEEQGRVRKQADVEEATARVVDDEVVPGVRMPLTMPPRTRTEGRQPQLLVSVVQVVLGTLVQI